jgi:cysteine desulfurase
LKALQHYFYDVLAKKVPTSVVNGSRKSRLPNNLHITLPGQDNERLLFALDEVGIVAAAGSACSASDEEPSHVLQAMGISERDARSSLRVTMGRQTTKADIDQFIKALAAITAQ